MYVKRIIRKGMKITNSLDKGMKRKTNKFRKPKKKTSLLIPLSSSNIGKLAIFLYLRTRNKPGDP